MRTTLPIALIASSVLTLAGLAQAETIAGWDFSQYAASCSFAKDTTLVPSDTLEANYSNRIAAPGVGPTAASFGTLYLNGSFGSTNVDETSQNPALVPTQSAPGSLASNLSAPTSGGPGYDPFDAQSSLTAAGQDYFNLISMTATAPVLPVFEALLGAPPAPLKHWELSLGGKTFSGTSTVGVEFSSDGVSYSPMTTFNLTTTDAQLSAPLMAAVTDKAYVRLSLDPSGGQQPILDNVAIVLLPEPSATAQAVASVLSLALFHRIRRRR